MHKESSQSAKLDGVPFPARVRLEIKSKKIGEQKRESLEELPHHQILKTIKCLVEQSRLK